jgi:hypothetical protein
MGDGLLLPGIALVWGISSLVSGEIVIPYREFKSLPIYRHIPLHGWPAILISSALISIAVCMHLNYFGNRYPHGERFSDRVSNFAGFGAIILVAVGVVVWLVQTFVDFFR